MIGSSVGSNRKGTLSKIVPVKTVLWLQVPARLDR